jgi:cullin-associated NEDD8-dissociated protein 1
LHQITELSIAFISYDPNYDSDQMDTEEGEEEEEDEEEVDDYSDDDDMSYKVRRASSKALGAIISTRPELLQELYQTVAPILISRFNEREETVKAEIFDTFRALLKQTNTLSKKTGALQGEKNPVNLLRPFVSKVVSSVTKQLMDKKSKNIKTKGGIFTLLRELVLVSDGILSDNISTLVPGIVFCFNDKNTNSTLKGEALVFLRLLLSTHPPKAFFPHIKDISPPVIKAVGDHSYKITAEALRVLSELIKVVRPPGEQFDFKPFVRDYFTVTLTKLKALDADQEVKESVINCTGLLLATLGDELKTETSECLKILLERLGNEITRLITVKTFAIIASSPLKIDLSSVLVETINQLSTFLRQNNRHLKQSSLRTLDVIVKNYGTQAAVSSQFSAVIGQLAPLITDADLHGSHLALNLIVNILRVHRESALQVKEKVFPKVMELLESSLLQGLALESLLVLLCELVSINTSGFDFEFLFNSLIGLTKKKLHKQCTSSIAQAIASLCTNAQPGQLDATVTRFIKDVQKDDNKLLALLCLGEIGRRVNLSAYESLQSTVVAVFDTSDETSLPSAAAFALGNIAVGNLSKFLPFILQDIEQHASRQYLLLHSLKEIISRQSESEAKVKALHEHLNTILPLLFKYAESPEESTRNVVAECLGKLALINPNELVPKLCDLSQSPSVLVRSTIITSLKFTIVEHHHPIDTLLLASMGQFLQLLTDPDLNVRRAALLTLNYAAHNKSILIRDLLPTVLPHVYAETKPKAELIREVDLGPFKHKVDDGLEIRKAAFECMYTLIETTLDRLDIAAFITHLVDGLKDVYDIKILSHLMLIRLAGAVPAVVIEALDILIEPLRVTITTKVKDNAVKQEVDRNEELVRSALRATVVVSRIPNVDQHPKFEEFLRSIRGGELADKVCSSSSPSSPLFFSSSLLFFFSSFLLFFFSSLFFSSLLFFFSPSHSTSLLPV